MFRKKWGRFYAIVRKKTSHSVLEAGADSMRKKKNVKMLKKVRRPVKLSTEKSFVKNGRSSWNLPLSCSHLFFQ